MPDKIVNHFVLADGSTAKYSAEHLAGDVPELVDIRTGYDGTVYSSAGDAVRGQVGELTGDITDIKNECFNVETDILVSELSGTTQYAGYASPDTKDIHILNDVNFVSYGLVVTYDCDIYVTDTIPNNKYYSICVTEGFTEIAIVSGRTVYKGSSASRYRNGDGNLPTINNKLHVSAGSAIVFSFHSDAVYKIAGLQTKYSAKNDYYKKRPNVIVPYVVDSSNDGFKVFTAINDLFVQYEFLHQRASGINCNCWRINSIAVADADLIEQYKLTSSGEIECAIMLDGRPDYIGGRMHGDEQTTNILFFVDGNAIVPSNITDSISFDELTVVTVSNLYDPNDSTTIVAEHGKKYIFTSSGLRIKQYVIWKTSVDVDQLYLAMLTASKAVTDSGYTNKSFVPVVLADSYGYYDNVDYIAEYSTSVPVFMSMEAVSYPNPTGSDKPTLRLTDNNNDYNKAYFVGYEGNVSIDDRMDADVVYTFQIGS